MTLDISTTLDRLHRLASQRGAELTQPDPVKAAFLMPLLAALGHDPFDPDQVAAGYSVDSARADFAAMDDEGRVMMALSAVSRPEDRDSPRARALAGVVAGTDAVAVLSSGRAWRFHLADAEGLEPEPFMAFDLSEGPVDPSAFAHLARDSFDPAAAVDDARVTRLDDIALEVLTAMLEEGSDAIARAVAERVAPGATAEDRSHSIVLEAMAQAARTLRDAPRDQPAEQPAPAAATEDDEDDRRPLTGDEEAAFRNVCEIASRFVDASRIHARPAQAYLAVLLDDNNRRTICRLYFSAHSTRYVGTFVGREETRNRIRSYAEVPGFGPQFAARLRELDPGAFDGVDVEEQLRAAGDARIETERQAEAAAADAPTAPAAADPATDMVPAEGAPRDQADDTPRDEAVTPQDAIATDAAATNASEEAGADEIAGPSGDDASGRGESDNGPQGGGALV